MTSSQRLACIPTLDLSRYFILTLTMSAFHDAGGESKLGDLTYVEDSVAVSGVMDPKMNPKDKGGHYRQMDKMCGIANSAFIIIETVMCHYRMCNIRFYSYAAIS
jgi:hypothetical protein